MYAACMWMVGSDKRIGILFYGNLLHLCVLCVRVNSIDSSVIIMRDKALSDFFAI